jgi:hypothetical protein
MEAGGELKAGGELRSWGRTESFFFFISLDRFEVHRAG